MYFRYLHDNLNLVDAFGTFNNANSLPTTPTNRIRPGTAIRAATCGRFPPISSTRQNSTYPGTTENSPTGNTWEVGTYGFNIPLPFPMPGHIPMEYRTLRSRGSEALSRQRRPTQFSGPYFSLLAPTTDISPSDNFVWQTGRHTFKFGIMYAVTGKTKFTPEFIQWRHQLSTTNNPTRPATPLPTP